MTRMLKIFVAALVALSLIGATSALAAENLVVNGSTTVLPIGQATAEAFMKKNPNVNISISGGGSGNGIKALIDKTTQIAMSSREMKKEEIELAKSRGVNPVEHKVAIDALTPVVHPSNPVKNLTIEQLSLIYQGKIRNWKEVGGKDLQIVVDVPRHELRHLRELAGEDPPQGEGDARGHSSRPRAAPSSRPSRRTATPSATSGSAI